MRRNHVVEHQYPAPADAPYASLDEAFAAGLKPLVRLVTGDAQARELLRLDEEPVQEKREAA